MEGWREWTINVIPLARDGGDLVITHEKGRKLILWEWVKHDPSQWEE